jgi:acetyl esterase/lipase
MKLLILAFWAISAAGSLVAQADGWQPARGLTQLPIWPGEAPDPQPVPGPEYVNTSASLFVGKPVTSVYNVSRPTITIYPPKGQNTGAAVVVFPGGGYMELAIDLEGTEVCDWLTAKGVTCVLLKYRVPHGGEYWDRQLKREVNPTTQMALEDAQRALGLVRLHAAEWSIDPHKIGVLGFSAGGHMVAATSTHFQHRLYSPVDAADNESCRPDFAVAIYPGHLSLADDSFGLNPDIDRNITS